MTAAERATGPNKAAKLTLERMGRKSCYGELRHAETPMTSSHFSHCRSQSVPLILSQGRALTHHPAAVIRSDPDSDAGPRKRFPSDSVSSPWTY
jgi:hypothetical protein